MTVVLDGAEDGPAGVAYRALRSWDGVENPRGNMTPAPQGS
jgi:hypothetical protein